MSFAMPSTALAAMKSKIEDGDTVTESASTRATAISAKETAHQSVIAAKDAAISTLTEEKAAALAAQSAAETAQTNAENAAAVAQAAKETAETALASLQSAVAAYLAKVDDEADATAERAALDALLPSDSEEETSGDA